MYLLCRATYLLILTPKGKLFIIGGHEDKGFVGETPAILSREKHPTHFEILGSLISGVPREHHIIEIIAAASAIQGDMEAMYVNAYKNVGFTKVGIIRIENEAQANDENNIKRIRYAHSVFFTGGDQKRLTSLLRGTRVLDAIRRKYINDEDFIVAGTSAGAMSIPATMIARGVIEEALLKGDLEMGEGLGLINNIIVDTHFIKRGRFGRLAQAVARNPAADVGIGLGEDAALIITNGNEAECSGSGMVVIIDGTGIGQTNIAQVDDYTPLAIENLKVHLLANGCRYLIKEKKFLLNKDQH